MRYSYILSLILLITPAFSLVCKSNTTFNLILSEDKKAFKSRQFHIFYDKHFKPIAELIKCQIDGAKIVKQVILEEVSSKLSLERICTLKKYEDKLKDPLKRNRMFMATISEQEKFKSPATCSAQNQFNVMRTPNHEWAVQIRGHISNVVLPMDKNIDHFTRESLAFALNALFFATTYGIGDSEFKTIGGATLKESLLNLTAIIYMAVLFVGAVALVILLILFFARRRATVRKRESEKSKLLRNQANNNCDDSSVDIVYND